MNRRWPARRAMQSSVPLERKDPILMVRCSGDAMDGTPRQTVSPTGSRQTRAEYEPHLSAQAVEEGIEKGYVFRGIFRVNAHNRMEAYCTVDGLPVDILISGVKAQNRAVDGDVVAVMVDSIFWWTKLKGSTIHSNPSYQIELDVISESEKDNFSTVSDNSHLFNTFDFSGDGDGIYENIGTRHSASLSASPSKRSESSLALDRLCSTINSSPSKRPTGKVVSIIKYSYRRDAIVGFVHIQQRQTTATSKRTQNLGYQSGIDVAILRPNDPRFPDMLISVADLPDDIAEKVKGNDMSVEMDVVAACMEHWAADSHFPKVRVIKSLGRGGEIETQIAAILFENNIYDSGFSSESLSCLPDIPWKIPADEIERRKDLRNLCIFTIDPPSASDFDDALSVEKISDNVYRVGVHIADVSYFVRPCSALDDEARNRSTSVFLSQNKVPMLPPLLSEFASLNPGVDRLAFSVFWDISETGAIKDQWVGQSVIHSCCKLSYELAQKIIDGALNADLSYRAASTHVKDDFVSADVLESVKILHKLSITMKENRFKNGALRLDSAKLVIVFDEHGIPCDGAISEKMDSNSLVEEFMLLANKTIAGITSKAYRECSLLRRQPEPNLRKLNEFRAFCSKNGFALDISSLARFQSSLSKIKEELKYDPVSFHILVFYASRPMQHAMYFCSGDLVDREDEWSHYALAIPSYTHFTSPLRRYPDIVVHRILSAVLQAEKKIVVAGRITGKCFTGPHFNDEAAVSREGRVALAAAATEFGLPGIKDLSEIAAYCNKRKSASKNAEESGRKVYLWAMLKNKEGTLCEARVVGLGPRFMSIYIHKFAIEKRIHYNEVEGLVVEWLENSSTLVLDLFSGKRLQKRGGSLFPLHDVVHLINPTTDLSISDIDGIQVCCTTTIELLDTAKKSEVLPGTFPLTLRVLSNVSVMLHAVGGDDGPIDTRARLYMSSYHGCT